MKVMIHEAFRSVLFLKNKNNIQNAVVKKKGITTKFS